MSGGKQQSWFVTFILPGQPPIDAGPRRASIYRRIKAPFFATVGGINGKKFEAGRRSIKHAVDHQRIALNLTAIGLQSASRAERSCGLQSGNVVVIDLIEGGVVRSDSTAK